MVNAWHGERVTELCACRQQLAQSQAELAAMLGVALKSAVPQDCDRRIRQLRHDLRLSQADLAVLIGAANKAVVYQWESAKRLPSPIFWQRLQALCRSDGNPFRRPLRLDQAPVAQVDRARAF